MRPILYFNSPYKQHHAVREARWPLHKLPEDFLGSLKDFLDRMKLLTSLNSFKIPIEPLGYTPEEFEEMNRKNNRFILEVLRMGKVLYEKDAVVKEVFEPEAV